jgi:hypothetical protein
MGSGLTRSLEFYVEVGRVFVDGELWGENLEALNILLHGGIRQIPGIVSAGLETCQALAPMPGLP